MAAPLFFVPLAVAGGRVFFKFASKKAAQAFKSKFAKAGNVTTRTPPKSATVTTTGSKKGKDIVNDMTKPVTKPTISPRNPNTKTLPKPPKKNSGAGTAVAAGTTAVGVAAGAKSAGENKTSGDSRKQYRPGKGKKAGTTPARTPMKNVGGKGPSRTAADKIAMDDTKMKLKQDKNYNVGVSRGGVSFKEAFAHFRKKGNKTFTWNDKKYTTELKKGKK